MKLDLIFTFDKAEQQRDNLPFVMPILKNKDTLIDFATSILSEEDKQDLIKISCCIEWFNDYEKNQKTPTWYNECNGKIWIDDLELWRKDRGIESKVSTEYINEFAVSNPYIN